MNCNALFSTVTRRLNSRRAAGLSLTLNLALGLALSALAPPAALGGPALPTRRPLPVTPATATAAPEAATPAAAAQALRYLILADGGREIGEQTVERQADGLIKVHYAFKEDGLGPVLDAEIRLAADGTLSSYRASGRRPYGAPVNESFSNSSGHAQWQTGSDNGAKNSSGPAFYMPLDAVPEVASLSVAAMIRRPGGKLALLPAGSLAQRRLDEQVVMRGNMSQRVQLVTQSGSGFAPAFYWATISTQPRLFAAIVPGKMTIIEDGWQASEKMLAARQRQAESRMLNEMAMRLQHPLNGLTVIRNTRVFDSEKAQLGAASDVYLLRGKIAAVLPAGTPMQGAEAEIDAGGRVMLPGLFDMHARLGRWDGALYLAAGVTSVRDVGSDNLELQQLIDEQQSGKAMAPHIAALGILDGEGPESAYQGILVRDAAEVRSGIDWYAQHGYAELKFGPAFPAALSRDALAYALSRGLRIGGQLPPALRVQDALDQGFSEFDHLDLLALDLLSPAGATHGLERSMMAADKTAALDLNAKAVQDLIAQLKQHAASVEPTLTALAFFKQREGELNEALAPLAERLPADVRRRLQAGVIKIADHAAALRYKASYDKLLQLNALLYRAGIALLAGGDGLPGFGLQAELRQFVKAGLSPAQALQLASWQAAVHLRAQAERGSIASGKLADLLLVDGDPTRDINDVRKVALVITHGKLIYPHEVEQSLGIAPLVPTAPLLRAIVRPAQTLRP
jgi:hypothetical protein